MSRPKSPSDRACISAKESHSDDGKPVDRFKSLARRLLSVSNKQLQTERRQHDIANRQQKK
jgi:hypothetical protein